MFDYVPILRHGRNEQEAMETLSSELSSASGDPHLDADTVRPLLEIIDEDDFNSLSSYTGSYDEVFVDFPRYLTDRDNQNEESVRDLISDYGDDPVRFFNAHAGKAFTPVVSGYIDPIDLTTYVSDIKRIQREFERIGVRIFIPVDEFSDLLEDRVESILGELRPTDAVMMDVVDIRDISKGIRSNLEFIISRIGDKDIYLLDLFEPRGDYNYNYSLVMSKDLGATGFGDFVLEPRFQEDIPPAAFQNIPRRIRQYQSSAHAVSTWEDPNHYMPVVEQMLSRGELDPDHCPFCQELKNEYDKVKSTSERTDLGTSFVKRMRMGHYQFAVLQDELPDLDAAGSADDFDSSGYADIT